MLLPVPVLVVVLDMILVPVSFLVLVLVLSIGFSCVQNFVLTHILRAMLNSCSGTGSIFDNVMPDSSLVLEQALVL